MKNAEYDRVVAKYRRGDGFVDLWLHIYATEEDEYGITADYCQARTVMEARSMAQRYKREWKAKKIIFVKK